MTAPRSSADGLSQLWNELALEAISLLDADGTLHATSDPRAQLCAPRPSVPGTFAEVHPDDLAEAERRWRVVLESPGTVIRSCLRMKHSDGSWRWIEASSRNLLSDPSVGWVVINWHDITEAKLADQARWATEARYRLIAENARDLILRISGDGRLVYVSQASIPILGRAPDAMVGTDYYQLVHPEDLAAVRQSHQASTPQLSAVPTHRCRRSDGSWAWFESNSRRLAEPDCDLVVIARDITHKRNIDEQFLQAQKMDAVGRLAGGVAHDFNNLLSIITSAGTLLHDELPADHPSQPMTEEIRVACRRAADLTRQLLAFSRRQMLVPSATSVNDVVSAALEAVKGQLGPSIKVTQALDPGVGQIHADAQQIERVVVALVLNARDAMPEGGGLILSTANVSIAASDLDAVADAPSGEYVRLRVEDSGTGMNSLTRAHLFEPFFTTKPRGKGVGLGLATSYGIIRQSGGHIRVLSELGAGSSFSLLFPRSAVVPAVQVEVPAPKEPAPTSGAETILLVEDDSAVRRVAAALLTKKGYRVLQAEGGKEALAVSDADLASTQLLLTDVMMPGLSGPEIAAALKERRPGLRVLFMSGYNNESVHNILQKPFTLDTLSRRVREMLDQPPS